MQFFVQREGPQALGGSGRHGKHPIGRLPRWRTPLLAFGPMREAACDVLISHHSIYGLSNLRTCKVHENCLAKIAAGSQRHCYKPFTAEGKHIARISLPRSPNGQPRRAALRARVLPGQAPAVQHRRPQRASPRRPRRDRQCPLLVRFIAFVPCYSVSLSPVGSMSKSVWSPGSASLPTRTFHIPAPHNST